MSGYQGLKAFLAGNQVTSLNDQIIAAPGCRLPEILKINVHKAENLYKPTLLGMLKFNPYISCYLTPDKQNKHSTVPKLFDSANPEINATLNMAYSGQPLLVIQAWDADLLRHEFIGETPVDLLSIVNTFSRKWTGSLTLWGFKGTTNHGSVWVTLEFIGGSPYDPNAPATHRSANSAFADDGRTHSPLGMTNLKKIAKSATCC